MPKNVQRGYVFNHSPIVGRYLGLGALKHASMHVIFTLHLLHHTLHVSS